MEWPLQSPNLIISMNIFCVASQYHIITICPILLIEPLPLAVVIWCHANCFFAVKRETAVCKSMRKRRDARDSSSSTRQRYTSASIRPAWSLIQIYRMWVSVSFPLRTPSARGVVVGAVASLRLASWRMTCVRYFSLLICSLTAVGTSGIA